MIKHTLKGFIANSTSLYLTSIVYRRHIQSKSKSIISQNKQTVVNDEILSTNSKSKIIEKLRLVKSEKDVQFEGTNMKENYISEDGDQDEDEDDEDDEDEEDEYKIGEGKKQAHSQSNHEEEKYIRFDCTQLKHKQFRVDAIKSFYESLQNSPESETKQSTKKAQAKETEVENK